MAKKVNIWIPITKKSGLTWKEIPSVFYQDLTNIPDLWYSQSLDKISSDKTEKFNYLFVQNKIGFRKAHNIIQNSNYANTKKDTIVFNSCLDFTSRRNMTLVGSGKAWNDWCDDSSLRERSEICESADVKDLFVRDFGISPELLAAEIIDVFYCLLYSFVNLNGFISDDRLPAKWLEDSFLIYFGVKRFIIDLDGGILDYSPEFSSLKTLDLYLLNSSYFDTAYMEKKGLREFKKATVNFCINTLKRNGLLEHSVGESYFVNNSVKNNVLKHYHDVKTFSFPTLSNRRGLFVNHRNADYQSIDSSKDFDLPLNPFDVYYVEYMDYCNGNNLALDYRSFAEYEEKNPNVDKSVSLKKYKESTLFLYSYLDFNCTRAVFNNKSIYYDYHQDWNFRKN